MIYLRCIAACFVFLILFAITTQSSLAAKKCRYNINDMPASQVFKLNIIDHQTTSSKEIKKPELSGLTIIENQKDRLEFLTVGDEEYSDILQLSTSGQIFKSGIKTGVNDKDISFELIAYDENHKILAVGGEKGNLIFFKKIIGKKFIKLSEVSLSDLSGYNNPQLINNNTSTSQSLASFFSNASKSGLEGGDFSLDGKTLYLIKEKDPSIMIAITLDHNNLKNSKITSADFLACGEADCSQVSPSPSLRNIEELNKPGKKLDTSGLQIIHSRGKAIAIIISDRGRAVIAYDINNRSYKLGLLNTPDGKCLKKAEGIAAYTSINKDIRLVVINDQKGKGEMITYHINGF